MSGCGVRLHGHCGVEGEFDAPHLAQTQPVFGVGIG